MRIAQVSPLYEAVPPRLYGGTERVVSYLTEELVGLGHEVSLFSSADAVTSASSSRCVTARCGSIPLRRSRRLPRMPLRPARLRLAHAAVTRGRLRWPLSISEDRVPSDLLYLKAYRYAATSRACCSVIPVEGMAVWGLTSLAARTHRIKLEGLFDSTPPICVRLARTPSRGGPTNPRAPGTPAMVWHPAQPFAIMIGMARVLMPR